MKILVYSFLNVEKYSFDYYVNAEKSTYQWFEKQQQHFYL